MTTDGWTGHLAQLARTRATHPDVFCSLGQALYAEGKLDAARSAFERALELNPSYVDAALSLGDVLADQGDVRGGYAQLRPMFGLAPDSFGIVFAIGLFCMRHGFCETGLSQLQRAVRLQPNAPFAARFLAAALEQLGDAAGAREQIARAEQLELGLPSVDAEIDAEAGFRSAWPGAGVARAQVHRARYLLGIGREDEAMAELALANARYPGHSLVMVETGRMESMRGRADLAERWFDGAIAVDPRCHEAFLELSFVHASAGRADLAVRCMRRVVELRPMFPDYRYGFGTLLLDAGEVAEAVVHLEQALLLREDDGHSALHLATAYKKQGALDDACQLLESGAWSSWPECRTLLAEIFALQERWDDARAVLEQVVAEMPDFESACEILAALPD